jgi:hypothetical protein
MGKTRSANTEGPEQGRIGMARIADVTNKVIVLYTFPV